MTATVIEGQSVIVKDPSGRGTVTGKVVLCRPSGCAVDDARGVRYWTTYDRVSPIITSNRISIGVKYHHDLFGPLMDIERELFA